VIREERLNQLHCRAETQKDIAGPRATNGEVRAGPFQGLQRQNGGTEAEYRGMVESLRVQNRRAKEMRERKDGWKMKKIKV